MKDAIYRNGLIRREQLKTLIHLHSLIREIDDWTLEFHDDVAKRGNETANQMFQEFENLRDALVDEYNALHSELYPVATAHSPRHPTPAPAETQS